MSRIGNKPVAIPSGVTVDKIEGGVRVKGPKGTLSEQLPASIGVEIEGGQVVFRRSQDDGPARAARARARAGRQHGEGRGDAVRHRTRDPGRRLSRGGVREEAHAAARL